MKVPLSTWAGLVVGLMIGISAGGAFAVGLRFSHVRKEAAQEIEHERAAWKTTKVVVFAEDVVAGENLKHWIVAERAVPVQFVSASNVRPEQVSLVMGRPLAVSVRKGDPLLWQYVPTAAFDAGTIALYPGE